MTIKDLFSPSAKGLGGAIARRAVMTLAAVMLTTVTAWAQNPAVSYIDENGVTQTITDYYALTGSETPDGNGRVVLNQNVVVVNSNVTYDQIGLNLNARSGSEIKLILCDGCTLTNNSSSNNQKQFVVSNNLTIYGQTNNSGKLVVNASNQTAIQASQRTLTVNGGTVESTSTNYSGRGLLCGALVFNGGNLKLEGGAGVICNSNSSQTVTLNWRSATDRVFIRNFDPYNNYVKTVNIGGAGGKCFTDGNGNYFGGTYTSGYSAFSGKELQPATARTLSLPDGVTASGALFTASSVDYYAPGSTVTLSDPLAAAAGYLGWQYTVNGTSIDGTSFTMPADANTTVALTHQPDPDDFSVNDAGTEYTIHTADGWGVFCDCLDDNDTYNRFIGKTVYLDDDITVSRMAGASHHDFCGTFNGQGHTLTVNYGTADSPITDVYAAPFRFVESGCVIEKLHVSGTITTSVKNAAGIVGIQYGAVTIRNCRSSVTINSSVNGDGTHGGLVAVNNNSTGSNLTIEGCLFDGKLLTTNGTIKCGGFIGWRGGTAEIHNSLYAPASPTGSETWVGNSGSATFGRNNVDTYNCYYTYLLNDGTDYKPQYVEADSVWRNGKAVCPATAAPVGDATHAKYTVSGITPYTNGLTCGETFYYGGGDNVSVSYVQTDGTAGPHNALALAPSHQPTTLSGWYYVADDIEYDQTVTLGADVTLILADGKTMSVGTSGSRISDGYCITGNTKNLTIYGQIGQIGNLNAYNSASNDDAVYVKNYAQHGGNVTIDASNNNALNLSKGNLTLTRGTLTANAPQMRAIYLNRGGYSTTVSGGNLTATGNNAIDSYLTLSGGTVNATGDIGINGTVSMTGGTLSADGSSFGIYGGVTLTGGTLNATGRNAIHGVLSITAGTVNANGSFAAIYYITTVSGGNLNATGGSYSIYDNINFTGGSANVTLNGNIYGTVTIADGHVFTDGTNYYAGTLTADEKTAINGQTLTRLTALLLADAADNTGAIAKCNGATGLDITLQGRTLYKDGAWNTLCLPFDLSDFTGTPLEGATVKALSSSFYSLADSTLTLTFSDDLTAIEAGKPYIVKWASGDNITNPIFPNVTISTATDTTMTDWVDFQGNYSPTDIYDADRTSLYLSDANALCIPTTSMTLNAFRASLCFHNERMGKDVNGDDEVNDADVPALVSLILGGSTNQVGDIDGDTRVSLADVTTLVNLLRMRNAPVSHIQSNVNLDFGGTGINATR